MADHDLAHLLHLAVGAAQDAGDLLRRDYLRHGGARGAGDKAEADEPAERIIRQRLLEATPEWGYIGEETGSANTDAEAGTPWVWLVDPNDGTEAYLKGWRGSAVSIGLLHRGELVLGVVNAFAAPDNEGDLVAWARGGPLVRNGWPVESRRRLTQLSEETEVIVTQAADHAPRENLACVEPGRYITATSVAYRLALVAAGEGDACVCLSHPGNWDYGGGQALVQAAGGALVNESGSPVTYGPHGEGRMEWVFGGPLEMVTELAGRDWGITKIAAKNFVRERYDLAEPVAGQTEADNGRLRRAQGCWLGQLCGDALGSMVEFRSTEEIRRLYPEGLTDIAASPIWGTIPGQPTDDSELALMLARTLLDDGGYREQHVLEAYCHWYRSRPFDIGNTIGRALGAASLSDLPRPEDARQAASTTSQANGALMRQSPLAVWGHALSSEELASIVGADTMLTHPHEVCREASETMIITLARVIEHGLDGRQAYELARDWAHRYSDDSRIRSALELARERPPEYERNAGHVLIAVQNAFYQALHAESLAEGMRATVMGGGDTDTNAAIAGALLGAIHGAREIPSQWRRAVLGCRPLEGVPGVGRPRPRAFWPVDAEVIAERLLFAGGEV